MIHEEIPTFRDPRLNSQAHAIAANAVKHKIQEQFAQQMLRTDFVRDLSKLQRQCAKKGKRVRIQVDCYRQRMLDYKNLVRAVDELLIDPLQRLGSPPALFSDRPTNIDLIADQSEGYVANPFIEIWCSESAKPCGRSERERAEKEGK